jgi:hypothetical protein
MLQTIHSAWLADGADGRRHPRAEQPCKGAPADWARWMSSAMVAGGLSASDMKEATL